MPLEIDNVEKYQNLIDNKIPVVLLCNELKGLGFSSVAFDNNQIVLRWMDGILQRAEVDQKAKKFVLITGDLRYSSNRECKRGFEEAVAKYEVVGESFVIPTNKERAFAGLLDVVNQLEALPDYFLVNEESYANGLKWILQNNKSCRIVTLGGELSYDKWGGQEDRISRNTMKLGEAAANIILEKIKSPVYFDDKRILIPANRSEYENLNWEPEAAPVTIRILGVKEVSGTQFFWRMRKLFEEKYNIKVDCEFVDYSELDRRLHEFDGKKSMGYDIVMLDFQWFPSICNDRYFWDLTEFIKRDDDQYLDSFFPIAKKEFLNFNYKGIFAIPILVTMQYLFYRRDLFEDYDLKWHFLKQYGTELRPPQNWTEFDVIAQFFTREFNPDSPVLYGTEFETREPINISEQFFPRQWSNRGSIVSKGEIVWDSLENYRAFANLKNAYQCSNQGLGNRWDSMDRNRTSILDGNVAMTVTYASHIPNTSANKEQAVDFSDIVATTIPGKKPLFGGWSMGVCKSSEHAYEAYKFIKWITSNQNVVVNSFLGGFLPKNIILTNSSVNNLYPWMKDIQKNFEYAQKRKMLYTRRNNLIPPTVVDSLLAASIHKLLSDEWGIEETIGNLQKDFSQLIL